MHLRVKFVNFAAASLLFSVSSPQPLMAIALDAVTSDTLAQETQNEAEAAKRLSVENIQQLNKGQLLETARTFEQALEIYRKSGATSSKETGTSAKEIEILKNLVVVYTKLKDWEKAIELSKATLALAQQVGDRNTELQISIALGDAYNYIGKYELAVESATAGLALAQELQNSQAKAAAFIILASAYQAIAKSESEYQKATLAAISGLTTAWKAKDRHSEAKAQAILGSLYSSLDKNQNAIVFSQDALKIAQKNNIPTVAASSLLTLGGVYLKQGEYEKVIESVEQGNDYLQKIQDLESAGAALAALGLAYLRRGNYHKSLDKTLEGLAISRKVKNPQNEALALIVLSLNYSESRDYKEAIAFINQSRLIAKEQKNGELEAVVLEVRGEIYRKAGEKEQAIASYQEAIAIGDSYTAKAGLARIYEETDLLATAIVYYKQAVNKNEEDQRRIAGLPIWLQESFPQAVQDINGVRTADIYRSLTNLLLSQSRIGEAQQVLELLKGQELREYADNTKASGESASLTITPTEQEIIKEYGSLIAFGKKLDKCQQTRCSQLKQLSEQRTVLTKQYYQALALLEIKIRNKLADDEVFVDPKRFALKSQKIVEAQPDTILIYPLVLEDKIWLLWSSRGGIFKSVEVSGVTQAQLEATVLKFRQLLQNRLSNIDEVKATGKQLYNWLLEPLEKELKANNIRNLVFSLDRSTRYIPMSALFDGEKYLIESYTVSRVLSTNLTKTRSPTIARPHAIESPLSGTQKPAVLALGLSDAVPGFKALPNVAEELDAIVRHNNTVDLRGIYPGQKFLNKAFDFFALRNNLSHYQILHIATHSRFVPGRANNSYLVLGTGDKLPVSDIEIWLNLRNVNLVVLSACETALGGPGLDGREIAGIGYYFLKGGAKTTIASLWRVDDRSTRLLMEQFYTNLARKTADSRATKAEALRLAQLELLNGNNDTANASLSVEQQGEQPVPANKSRFRHPYYWSPFIMMGSGI